MHKKVVALLSAGILLFSLGACGSPSVAKDGKDTAAVDDEHAFTFSCVSYDASGRKGARVSFTSYKDGWDKTGTTYDCTADEQVGEPSRKVMDALKTVHVKDDGADYGARRAYAECASTTSYPIDGRTNRNGDTEETEDPDNRNPFISSFEAQDGYKMLQLCPDHPKADQIKANADQAVAAWGPLDRQEAQ